MTDDRATRTTVAGDAVTGSGLPGRLELTGLRARGHHGVHDFERAEGQEFGVDVVLDLDIGRAVATDDVAETVHYGELATRLIAIVEGEPVNLIETLAARLAECCIADDRVAAATVTVHKPHAPIPYQFTDVSVTVTVSARRH